MTLIAVSMMSRRQATLTGSLALSIAVESTAFYGEYGCGIGFKTLGCSLFTLFQVVTGRYAQLGGPQRK